MLKLLGVFLMAVLVVGCNRTTPHTTATASNQPRPIPVQEMVAHSWQYDRKTVTVQARAVEQQLSIGPPNDQVWYLSQDAQTYFRYSPKGYLTSGKPDIHAAFIELPPDIVFHKNAIVTVTGEWQALDNQLKSPRDLVVIPDDPLERAEHDKEVREGTLKRNKDLSAPPPQ